MSRRLVLLLLAHRNDDQDDDRDDVGQHLHKVGDVAGLRKMMLTLQPMILTGKMQSTILVPGKMVP